MNRQCWILAGLTVAAMVTGGCAGQRGADDLLITAEAADQLDCRIQWQQNLALPRGVRFHTIAPMNELMATLDTGHVLSLLETADGNVRWAAKVGTGAERLTGPRRGDDWITVSGETTAFVYKLSGGDLMAKVDLAHVAATTPVLDAGYAIYGSPTGMVFAQDLFRGVVAWRYKLTGGVMADPLLTAGTVIACDSNGSVAAFNPTRGNLLWRKVAPPWRRIIADPAANEAFIFVASEDQALYGFERTTGRFWKYLTESPLERSPVAVADRVFQDVPAEGIVCLDAYTGEVVWRSPETHGRVVMVTHDDRVLVAQPGRLIRLDSETGQRIDEIALPKVDRVIADSTFAGNLYLANDAGQLLKLSPR